MLKSTWYDNYEDVESLFDADVFDNLVDYDEEGGKHDCTECSGMFQDKAGDWWSISYSRSYNDGIQGVDVMGPYTQVVKEVVVKKNTYFEKSQ